MRLLCVPLLAVATSGCLNVQTSAQSAPGAPTAPQASPRPTTPLFSAPS